MKYLAIEFSNKYLNQFKESLDIMNNYIMVDKIPYYDINNINKFNELPLWMAHINGIVNNKLNYHIGSTDSIIKHITDNAPKYVFFSEMDTTSKSIQKVLEECSNQNITFIIGNRNNNFKSSKYIKVIRNMRELNKMFNFDKPYTLLYPNDMTNSFTLGRIYLTNGCNNNCIFCLSEKGVTKLEHSEIINQFDIYRKSIYIYIGDLTFGQEVKHQLRYLNMYKRQYSYIVQSSVECVLDNVTTLKSWKEANIRYVELGVESFNDDTLKRLGKNFTVAGIYAAIKYLNEVGIKVILNIMLNIKGETLQHYMNTINEIKQISDDISHLNITYYSDYKSKIEGDSNQLLLIKSWNNDISKLHTIYFANEVYKLNYKLLTKK